MAGKFTHFRHSVTARNDEKLKEFSRLLGRKSKEAYFYFFTLLELCASESDEGQVEFKIHNETLRTLWESNVKGVQSVCKVLAKSTLLMCEPYANHVVFKIPNLPKYLGSSRLYIGYNKIEDNSIYNIKGSKKKASKKSSKKPLPKLSPLRFLFSEDDSIQEWLREGSENVQQELLDSYSHHVLAEEVKSAYQWQLEREPRIAGLFLKNWMKNKKSPGFGLKQPQKPKTTVTPDNPTGNPYLEELRKMEGA